MNSNTGEPPASRDRPVDPSERPNSLDSNGVQIQSGFLPAPKIFLLVFAAGDRAWNRGLIMTPLRSQNEAGGLVLGGHHTAVEPATKPALQVTEETEQMHEPLIHC
jgi:hypothetical protein